MRYDRLLLATGAEPVPLAIPGAGQLPVHTLRSLADCRAIIEAAKGARRALVVGASFIGLEVAAALAGPRHRRSRGGAGSKRRWSASWVPKWVDFVRALHEEHGVVFHLGDTVAAIDGRRATLKSGESLAMPISWCRHRRAAAPGAGRSTPASRSIAASW